ncbi:MAG: RagB/SusD family nutrient uptake outer membrane protein [Gemmatimonadaceae bacterium]|nr:RagB/SusD family nutrient uptake outer membrane protein [Gemmatimonadaceae bacterium]
MTRIMRVLAGASVLATGACSLDLTNPNSPTQEEVLADPAGLLSLAVGMQGQFSQTIDDYLVTNSLITDEWGTRSLSLIAYQSLLTGQNFDASYGVVSAPFSNSYAIIKSANTILTGADQSGLGVANRAGVVALAKLFKAMALGMLIQQYEKVPITISDASVPQPRSIVMDTILTLLESARADLATVTDAQLSEFRSQVVGTGFNQRATTDAMLARYYLIAGRHNDAITAADRVPLNVLSVFQYPDPNRNPIENLGIQLRYVAPLRSFVTQAEAGDRRPDYWVETTGPALPANPPDTVLRPFRKYSTRNESFPVYLPDEMKLIKAEAFARTNRLAEALILINQVRTQTSSTVDEPVAGLPAIVLVTQAEMLAEIAKQRRYELYEQGLRWEDTRRFGTAITTTPTFQWLPLPQRECDANPANPCG